MTFFLLFISSVLLMSVLMSKLTDRIGIPVLLGFLALGMLFGSDGLFRIPFENFDFANHIATVALIFIIFYGGFGTNWNAARPVAVQSILLSTLGVLLTAVITGLFCRYALRFDWLESLLIGAVLSSTDAASVFSILRSKNLSLKYNTASMLELESGSNDPCAYMMTYLLLAMMGGGITAGEVAVLTLKQVFFGVAGGGLIAWGAAKIIRRFRDDASIGQLLVVAIALLSYALPTWLEGNGYLSAYIVGLVLGNQRVVDKKELVHFMDGLVSLMQIALFFLLGLLSTPSRLPDCILPALGIMVFLTVISRPASMLLLLTPFNAPLQQQGVMAWAGLRGATSIVFAIMVVISGVQTEHDLFHIAFCVVLLSIGIQGTFLPWCAARLDMIDPEGNVMRTFNDYSDDDTPVQFIRLRITQEHPWFGLSLKDISMPPDLRAALILQGETYILPRGETVLQAGDTLILSAMAYQDERHIQLCETSVSGHPEWHEKYISEIDWDGALVILIRRGEKTILPTGGVRLLDGDVAVLANVSIDR